MSTTVTYKGSALTTVNNQTRILKTAGKYMEDNVTLVDVSGSSVNNQDKTVTPTTSQQSISADSGYTGLGIVTVNAIPSQYIVPSGNLAITSNGTGIDVTQYASVSVDVPVGSTINNQDKTVTPTESQQIITADEGYTGLGTITVNAISSTYVGSGITRNPQLATNIADHSMTISANPGYYSESQDIEISTAQFGEPTGRYSGRDGLLYFTLPINTAGYWDTDNSFSLHPSDITDVNDKIGDTTITPTESPQQIADFGDFIEGTITVDAIPSTYVGSGITQRTSDDLTVSGATVSVPAGYYSAAASKSVATGTEGAPTALKGTVTDNSITVTPSVTNTAGYISGGTHSGTAITVSASELVSGIYNVTASGTHNVTNYASASVPAGTTTSPTSISDTAATISTGSGTLTLTKTVSVTPRVTTAGYVTTGTAGNSSVTLTASVTTKAAATITPGTTNQTIAAGTYLTGTQTIAGDANLIGSNILSTASIFGVQGAVVIQNYYTGSSAPSSSLGSNGDIYIQS